MVSTAQRYASFAKISYLFLSCADVRVGVPDAHCSIALPVERREKDEKGLAAWRILMALV